MTNESKSATVDNYPVLDKWLQEQCAKCLTSFAQSSRNGARATMWSFAGGGTALVLCHPVSEGEAEDAMEALIEYAEYRGGGGNASPDADDRFETLMASVVEIAT